MLRIAFGKTHFTFVIMQICKPFWLIFFHKMQRNLRQRRQLLGKHEHASPFIQFNVSHYISLNILLHSPLMIESYKNNYSQISLTYINSYPNGTLKEFIKSTSSSSCLLMKP